MENIIKMLQEKVGITKVQAEKVIELLKGVFGDSTDKAAQTHINTAQKIDELEDEAENTANETSDTLNEYVDKIRNIFGSSNETKKR